VYCVSTSYKWAQTLLWVPKRQMHTHKSAMRYSNATSCGTVTSRKPPIGKIGALALLLKIQDFTIRAGNSPSQGRKAFVCIYYGWIWCGRYIWPLHKHVWCFWTPQNASKPAPAPKPGLVGNSIFGWKLCFDERNMLLKRPNELKPYFPVVFDMNISFLKLVWSSRPFRRLEKLSGHP